MPTCYVAGIGLTNFGRFPDRTLKSLAGEAVQAALNDAGLLPHEIEAAYSGTVASGYLHGQVMIPGEMVLRSLRMGRIPVVNVENACATSATAFQQAVQAIRFGMYEVVLVVGFEKLSHSDKSRTFGVFQGATDVEDQEGVINRLVARTGSDPTEFQGCTAKRSIFMDLYAGMARDHMDRHGSTPSHFAAIAEKNSFHGSLNHRAQYRDRVTVAEVLKSPMISDPLTLMMCSPIGDGAAALVLVSGPFAKSRGLGRLVTVRTSVLVSGYDDVEEEVPPAYAARLAYSAAAIGPGDLDVVELHDGSAPAELMYYEHLGLAPYGDGVALLESGATRLGGRIPVNPSGGLLRKGHPLGATGAAQVHEIVTQLRGEAGARQVEGAKIGLAENGGGHIRTDVATIVISVLEAAR